MTDTAHYINVPVSLIKDLERRIETLEQAARDRELEETLDFGKMATKNWVHDHVTFLLRSYKEK